MYTVVICPECREGVWFVDCAPDPPDRTQCITCGHTRQFKRLKHCHKTEDKDEARLAVAEIRAKNNDQEDLFEEAYESGVLTEDPDEFFESKSDLDEVIETQLNEMENDESRSEKQIIQDGIQKQESPSVQDAVDYAADYGVDRKKTRKVLKKLQRNGTVIESGDGLKFI